MKTPHILIVNIEEKIRVQLSDVLNKSGSQKISFAENGSQAVDLLQTNKIDLVITDIPLGNLDGWRLTRLIRSGILKTPAATPVVVVSTIYSERIAEITAKEHGINHFCTYHELEQIPDIVHTLITHPSEPTKTTLLVIEDYPDTVDLIHRILSKQFDIETALDGESGLAAWQARRHDLVLLDVMLPRMSGEQVLDNILQTDPDQTVVIMTAHGSAECAGTLILKGAVDFISKPFLAGQLRNICNIAARRRDFMISNEQYAQHTENLRASEARFRRLVENLKEDHFFYTRDPQGNYTYISPSITSVLGYDGDDYIKNHNHYLTNNPINIIATGYSESSLQGIQQPSYEFEIRHHDGSLHHLEATETPILHKQQVVAVDGIVHDVTQRIAIQKQLKQLADATFEAVIIHDKGKILEANQIYSELTGIGHDDSIGKNLCDTLISGNEDLTCQNVISNTELPYELNIRDIIGTSIPVEVRTRQIDYNGMPSTVTAIRDLTRQKQAEKKNEEMQSQLRQAQKMEAVGQLTGGIAHDFNNILASIMGYAELTIDIYALDKESKLSTYLSEIYTAAERARDLIQKMLIFSRGNSFKPEPHRLKSLIEETITMLRSTIPSSININLATEGELTPVLIDSVQFHQIIMNLCINARDAIHGGIGSINLELSRKTYAKEACASCHHTFSGEFVELSIHDSGTGIEPELITKIFDPFFSTKEVGKGTGMGLSMVHGIMHEHNGHIMLDSSTNNGTTFKLLLPVYQGELVEQSTVTKMTTHALGSGHILVVDDDISLSHFLQELLQNYGYQITVINDPREAIELFENGSQKIDLVLTDQTMPNIPGDLLATSILKKHPDMPIILCTGYSERIDKAKAMQLNISGFITKPIKTKELTSMVDNLLDRNKLNAISK